MRRIEKQITDPVEIENLLCQCRVCRIGLSENNIPYIVPMSFGYKDNTLYLHSAPEGRKIDMLKKNPHVCFECDILNEVVASDHPCSWGMDYQSVIGFGTASFIDDPEEKKQALNIIMEKYAGKSFEFPESTIRKTAVINIAISSMTGKRST